MRWSMDENFMGQIFQYAPSKNSRSSNKKIAKKMTFLNQVPQSALRLPCSINCSTPQAKRSQPYALDPNIYSGKTETVSGVAVVIGKFPSKYKSFEFVKPPSQQPSETLRSLQDQSPTL
jgi:hypothetical protein